MAQLQRGSFEVTPPSFAGVDAMGPEDSAPSVDAEDPAPVADGGGPEEVAPEDPGPCYPECFAKQCGDDGCGGVCGFCPEAFPFCFEPSGVCSNCLPDCEGLLCGPDGCGGSCGSCGLGAVCESGACVCAPDCPDEACGAPDGCGGVCPACPAEDVLSGDASDTVSDAEDTTAEDTAGPDPEDASSDAPSEDSGGLTDASAAPRRLKLLHRDQLASSVA